MTCFGPGFVYVTLGSRGLRKIGLSVDPERRARELGGDIEHIIRTSNMRWLEQYLHDAFWSRQRGTGEWYDLTEDDMALLRGVTSAHCEGDLPHGIQSLHAEPRAKYTITKIDDELLPFVRAAAALAGQTVQDFISDAANEAAARVLKREPIKRRPPEPKTRKPKG